MDCKNQKLSEGSASTKHTKVNKTNTKKHKISIDCKYQNDYESTASNKQIKVNILNSNYDRYMCLINFYT
jgi:hypothetical protein